MTVSDTWKDWKTTAALDTPPSTATPEIDKELRNIKAQVKANVAPAYYAADYAGLLALITAIGSDTSEIVIDSPISITADLTIPANITVKRVRGGYFTNAAADTKDITILGPIESGRQPLFVWSGTGTVDISSSPTSMVFPEWWGAIAETSGWTQDNQAALTLMVASLAGQRQEVLFGDGWYRIASALAVGGNGARWKGSGIFQSGIWIDIGGTGTGVTFGVPLSGGPTASVELSDMSFLGPAACCEYGVDFIGNNPHVRRVNFYMGATAYACRTRSTEGYEMNPMYSEPNSGNPATAASPAGAFKADIETPGLGWANNTAILNIHALGSYTIPCIYLDGTGSAITLTGAIQGVAPGSATEPLRMVNCETIRIADIYTEGFTDDINIINCIKGLTIDNILFFNGNNFNLVNCTSVDIGPSWIYGTLNINAGCRGVTVRSGGYIDNVVDDAPDTDWRGVRSYTYDYGAQKGRDKVNLWYNSSFNRWQSDKPDGIGYYQITWTKCGTGLVDTTNHLSPYCAKAETDGGAGLWDVTLDATQLNRVLGQTITHSLWEYFPTGQTLNSSPLDWSIAVTVPDWTSKSYQINDAVKPSAAWLAAHPAYSGDGVSNMMWVCTVAGASGASEPTWGTGSTTTNTVVTDGAVTWVAKPTNVYSYKADPYTVAMQGTWHRDALTQFVPRTATVVYIRYDLARQANGTDEATVYIAEPSLVVSNQRPTALVESAGEFQNFIQVGAIKIWANTPAAGQYCNEGDLDLALAQRCTTSGIMGSGAVWAAW